MSCGGLLSDDADEIRLGEYHLLEQIGEGGAGVVHRAIHDTDKREVAVKLLNQKSFGDVQQMERFRREMRMHEKLEHPNIIKFIEVCEQGEALALVMEYLEGCSLKEFINHRGAMALGELIRVSESVLTALETAHAKDIIHRDLKPSNIFMTNDGDIKLMDFGLAKPSKTNDEDITDSGMTVGTYLYMAPEQILGEKTGVFTDLYAFGIVLYRMSTAVLPFMATDGGEFEIMEKQVRQLAENPQTLNPKIPNVLAELIMNLLSKKPSERPQSCAEVLTIIKSLGEGEQPTTGLDAFADKQVSAFSDLNSSLNGFSGDTGDNVLDERSTTHTVCFHTLLAAFAVESPPAPKVHPFDMRHPPELSKETLKHLRIAISNIPPLPEIWHQVQTVFEDAESSPADLAKVIVQDAVLAAYVLKTCNSAAYLPSGSKAATDVAIALTRIGMAGAQALILNAVVPDFSAGQKSSIAVRRVWFHGQAVAMFSSILSEYSKTVDSSSANMFGLLHDIGKLVILYAEPDEKLDALKQRIVAGQDTLSAELEVLGYSHIDAGMMLALHWKLPRKLHRFIYYHHFPCWQHPESWPPDMQAPIMLVHMAHLALSSVLAKHKVDGKGADGFAKKLNDTHESVWQDNFRSHVKGSESILQKPLYIPMTDASLYSQLRMKLERLKLAFPDLYSVPKSK
ncbi:MAG: protein kinase [Ghiorsea sp.]